MSLDMIFDCPLFISVVLISFNEPVDEEIGGGPFSIRLSFLMPLFNSP